MGSKKKKEEQYWRKDKVFNELCTVVMENRLVCLTGAGVSKGLELENGQKSPDWKELLQVLSEKLGYKLDDEQKKDIDSLLEEPKGEELIEVATILRKVDKQEFEKTLAESVKIKEGEYTETHSNILKLMPNGIITYNYDNAHEYSMGDTLSEWKIIKPDDEQEIKSIIINRFRNKFLLKAHGTVSDEKSMILTRDAYRNLFVKRPAYKAFLQNILTNYQLLIIGFGFSDPDFDMLIKNIFSAYGSPIQKHIVIKHIEQKNSLDTLYKLRYGMNYLYVNDFDDIPFILEDCISDGGEYIESIVNSCLSNQIEERSRAHKKISNLSIAGKTCLAKRLKTDIKRIVMEESNPSYDQSTELSELVYSFGLLLDVDKKYKDFLINYVVEKSLDSEPVAHALTKLVSHLSIDDLPRIDRWIEKFEKHPFREDSRNPDPDKRNITYCKYLKVYVEAKYVDHKDY